jgi:phospholipid/cholesterol/gamma-HCH transport system substrate-binding protein
MEWAVGWFALVGGAAVAYLAVSLGGVRWFSPERTQIEAKFATVGDLKEGAAVKLAGVRVGQVDAIRLQDYAAWVQLSVDREVLLPSDTIASIRTSGLLGESYVSLSPGGAEKNLASGDRITQTEPPLDLLDLIGKYAFGSLDEGKSDSKAQDDLADPFE